MSQIGQNAVAAPGGSEYENKALGNNKGSVMDHVYYR